ncbi:hypothetical protein BCR43DRAFT_497803 [Syncephalastrum racemosum]|uniref:Uncharacterized protein n=1 Tax=Syncephalastrum racemosum TaxID=13706 RepID=A0A1X2H401_SYNRA|nr:hypothetical protein BCR43DRAFT_497803 [Syncephalastrum racemosum]
MIESTLRCMTLHCLNLAFAASLGSTGALHYLLSPFINAIYLQPGSKTITPNTQVTMETLDLLARRRHTTVALKDLEPSSGLLLTWTVRKQYQKGLPQTRFWLDKRNGVGDREAMRKILRITTENQQQKRVVL